MLAVLHRTTCQNESPHPRRPLGLGINYEIQQLMHWRPFGSDLVAEAGEPRVGLWPGKHPVRLVVPQRTGVIASTWRFQSRWVELRVSCQER